MVGEIKNYQGRGGLPQKGDFGGCGCWLLLFLLFVLIPLGVYFSYVLFNPPIVSSSIAGNKKNIQHFIQEKVDIEKRGFQQRSALHFAVLRGDQDIAKWLIEGGANVNAQDVDGLTPLHMACHENQIEMIQLILENQADPNRLDVYERAPLDLVPGGWYCLHEEGKKQQEKIVQLIEQHGGRFKKFKNINDPQNPYSIGPGILNIIFIFLSLGIGSWIGFLFAGSVLLGYFSSNPEYMDSPSRPTIIGIGTWCLVLGLLYIPIHVCSGQPFELLNEGVTVGVIAAAAYYTVGFNVVLRHSSHFSAKRVRWASWAFFGCCFIVSCLFVLIQGRLLMSVLNSYLKLIMKII